MQNNLLKGAMAVALVVSGAPSLALARTHHHHRHYEHCQHEKHRAGAIGAVSGAVGGGIIGSALTHGSGPAVLLGAGAGALTGHALAKSTVHCH